ncbi:M16 family metallopeptidase [Parapedobacter sp. 10938]|uniref:M16 family metallopeptidase n=1 Tax=Parapedobacter flavus TaxID=3110225 RepID=UPI002DBE5D9B|nr:pitrilysin family protein [Parapedobacter sp. 10938]MEC3880195.1 pitrilysin family protein [Parapedobacter sp. 10938]
MLNRTIAPGHFPTTRFDLIKPQHVTFSNGLQAFFFDAGEQELVRIEWITGNVFTAENRALLNTCVCDMLLEGTTAHSSAQLAEHVDFHGAFLVPSFGYDHSSLTLFSLNKHLPTLLPLVQEVLTGSIFPDNELSTYIRNSAQKLQVSLKKNSFVARRQFNRSVFGESRYGYTPDLIDYKHINRDDLRSLFRKQYQPVNGTLIVSGKVTDEVIRMLERLFGEGWQNAAEGIAPNVSPAFVPVSTKAPIVVERADALQSAIRLGGPSIQRSHLDFPGLQVVNTLLGGYFGSRLMANIREDKGYTYNIGSGLASLKHGAFFTIASEVGVDVTEATLVEIQREVRRLREEPVPAAELALVRNYMMGAMLGSLENVFSHADKFKNAYFSGLGLDYYSYYTDVVNSITQEEVQRLANAYLDYDKMVKVVVGKLS